MGATIARNVKFEVESTRDAAKTITAGASGITKANPGVVTATAHGYANGDAVVLTSILGMIELDGQIARVANVTTNTFELEGIDTTQFSTFVSGNAQKISAWATLGQARTISVGSVSPNRKDASTLISTDREYLNGLTDTPEITVDTFADPFEAAFAKVEAASRLGTKIGWRVTFQGTGAKRLFAGEPTLPSESISFDELVTGGFSITQTKRRLAFAT